MIHGPQVSVITPAYNAAVTIGRTIASVQAQTFHDWEHIIIDDGSTDDTRAAVDAARDSRLRYTYQPNQGPAEARNHGIRVSHGDQVIFLDADDGWDERCLERLQARSKAESPGAITHGDWAYIDSEGHIGRTRCTAFAAGDSLNTLLLGNPMAIHSVLAPRQAIIDVGGFATSGMLEDWHLWLRLARAGHHFVHTPALVAYYFWQPGSRSRNIERRKSERLATLDEIWATVGVADPLQSIREPSYATAYIDLCVSRFGQGDDVEALAEFDAAVARHRPVMEQIDTYYRIAYAEQSAHEGATEQLRETLDQEAAGRRIDRLLDHIREHYSAAEARTARRAAYAALGMAHYHERRHAPARAYLWSAVRSNPAALLDRTVGGTLARALMPVRLLDSVRERRRGG